MNLGSTIFYIFCN